jgi:hypothetical protein
VDPVKTFVNQVHVEGCRYCVLLYRPEYYKIDEWDDDEASPTAGQAEIMIANTVMVVLKTFV